MSILKLDIDVKMSEELLKKFLLTRYCILDFLGYFIEDAKVKETKKGYHIWIHLEGEQTDREIAELQFLLGDDQIRSRFNFLRLDAGVFHQFNALFSKKVRKVEA